MTTYRILAQIGPTASGERDASSVWPEVTVGGDECSVGRRRVIGLFMPRYRSSLVVSSSRATRGRRCHLVSIRIVAALA